MRFARPLLRGTLLRRYNRFLAEVAIDGETHTAHCPNPGAMLGLAAPGTPIWLEPNDDPKRKLRWGWRLVELPGGRWAGIDTSVPNRLAAEALAAGAIPELAGYATVRAEAPCGKGTRFDFLLTGPGRAPCWVEVKNVHLRREGDWAEFPDCVTARGARHLAALAARVAAGERAAMLYVVQRDDCARMRFAADIDPAYAAAFAAARAQGVEAYAYGCALGTEALSLAGPLPLAA